MNKKSWIIIAIVIALVISIGLFLYFKNEPSSNKSNYESNRTSTNNLLNQDDETNTDDDNDQTNSSSINEITQGIIESEKEIPTTEEELATYTTKIYSKDSARQNNISITCDTLNGTIVKNESTFSFCGTVGQSSTSKGYQEADIFDKNGNKKKGLGGRKLSN